MGEIKLLALRLGRRLLNTSARHQLFAPNNLRASIVSRDYQGFACCHHNYQMIHTIPNPVKFFLKSQ